MYKKVAITLALLTALCFNVPSSGMAIAARKSIFYACAGAVAGPCLGAGIGAIKGACTGIIVGV